MLTVPSIGFIPLNVTASSFGGVHAARAHIFPIINDCDIHIANIYLTVPPIIYSPYIFKAMYGLPADKFVTLILYSSPTDTLL